MCACKHFIILFYCTSDVHRMWFCVYVLTVSYCVLCGVHMFFRSCTVSLFSGQSARTHARIILALHARVLQVFVFVSVCVCFCACVCVCLCLCVFAYKLVDVYFLLISFLLCFSSSLSPPSFLTQTQSA